MKRLIFLSAFAVFGILLAGCDSADPGDDHGEAGDGELITRVVVTLSAGGSTITAEASDPDGDGTDIQIQDLVVQAGTTYQGFIQVFDDVNGENVGEEIAEEAESHQFFFEVGGSAAQSLDVQTTDSDANGLPVGLEFQLDVADGASGSATFRVLLSHFDDSTKNGTTRSDETDIDVTFPVTIE